MNEINSLGFTKREMEIQYPGKGEDVCDEDRCGMHACANARRLGKLYCEGHLAVLPRGFLVDKPGEDDFDDISFSVGEGNFWRGFSSATAGKVFW